DKLVTGVQTCALPISVTIVGAKGERTSSVEALYSGYLETTLQKGELITRVDVPALGRKRAAYLKCTTRSADDWPALGVAVVLEEIGRASCRDRVAGQV